MCVCVCVCVCWWMDGLVQHYISILMDLFLAVLLVYVCVTCISPFCSPLLPSVHFSLPVYRSPGLVSLPIPIGRQDEGSSHAHRLPIQHEGETIHWREGEGRGCGSHLLTIQLSPIILTNFSNWYNSNEWFSSFYRIIVYVNKQKLVGRIQYKWEALYRIQQIVL